MIMGITINGVRYEVRSASDIRALLARLRVA